MSYSFDGLEEWENELAQMIEQRFPQEFENMVIQAAYRLQAKVKDKTPKKTGRLQNSWTVGNIKKTGGGYAIEVYTNVEYAEPLEYGHRTRGGGFVPGVHMMEISLSELEQEMPVALKAWLDDFLATH